MKKMLFLSLFLFFNFVVRGQFSDALPIGPTPLQIDDLAASNFDNNGIQDIIFYSHPTKELIWVEFADSSTLYAPKHPIATLTDSLLYVSTADLDNDGDEDIITVDASSQVAWYRNTDGLGTFGAINNIITGDGNPSYFDVGDIDADGDIDIITVLNGTSSVVWFENIDGLGNFATQHEAINNSLEIRCVRLMDYDGNNTLDLFASIANGPGIIYFDNINSSGVFENQQILSNNIENGWFDIGDIDSDDDLDIVSCGEGDIKLSWFRNTGSSFIQYNISVINDFIPYKVVLLDYDFNNKEDIILTSYSPSISNKYYLSRYEKQIESTSFINEPLGFGGSSEIPYFEAFLDEDNYPDHLYIIKDYIFEYNTHNSVFWKKNTAVANEYPSEIPIIVDFDFDQKVFYDIDNDGDLDVFGNTLTDILWIENFGDGNFSERKIYAITAHNVEDLFLKDMDGDGDEDLFIMISPTEVYWVDNFENLNSPNFTPNISTLSEDHEIWFADMDGDGDLDICRYYINHYTDLVWYRNDSQSGLFTEEITVDFDNWAYTSILFADLYGENPEGFFAINPGGIFYFTSNDNGMTFQKNTLFTSISLSEDYLQVADMDGDGDLDIIFSATGQFIDGIFWIENIGNSSNMEFGNRRTIASDLYTPRNLTVTDFDNDGDSDVAFFQYYAGLEGSGHVVYQGWVENLGLGNNFAPIDTISIEHHILNSENRQEMYVVDFDGDGLPDIFADTPRLVWFKNLSNSQQINGTTYYDTNQNSIQDPTEINISNQEITINPNALKTLSTGAGTFSLILDEGDYEISCQPSEGWTLTTDSILMVAVDTLDVDISFGLTPNGVINASAIDLSFAPTRCGFTVPFWLTYSNNGNQINSGQIHLELDPLTTYSSASPVPDLIDGNHLYWDFTGQNPTYDDVIELNLIMPSADFIGETVNFISELSLLNEAGELEWSSIDYASSQINCSYDPNDKTVNPSFPGYENYTLLDDILEYTVRFQNTGTDTAFNILIVDYLDENLDITSFEVLAASHHYGVTIEENRKVSFRFNDILLPDSTTNQIESNGFIKYRVALADDVVEGTEVQNTASIYFDFNEPIITNTTENLVVEQYPLFADIVHPSCSDSADGSISIDFPFLPVEYFWDFNDSQSNVSGLAIGNYNVLISNQDGFLLFDTIFTLTSLWSHKCYTRKWHKPRRRNYIRNRRRNAALFLFMGYKSSPNYRNYYQHF